MRGFVFVALVMTPWLALGATMVIVAFPTVAATQQPIVYIEPPTACILQVQA